MSAQPARVIPLPHRPSSRPSHGAPLESFQLEGITPATTTPAPTSATDALFAESVEALERDEPAKAARLLTAILQSEPTNAEALLALGSIQHTSGDSVAAAESYRRAAAADPAGWQPLYNHALLCETCGEPAAAMALLHHAIALAPQEALPQARLAALLDSDSQQSEARIWWKRAVSSNSSLHGAWLQLGLLELRRGRLADAATALQSALGGEREAAEAAYHLGLAHIGMGAPQEAAKAFSEAVRRNPSDADAHAALASLALDTGDLDTADRHERAGRMIQPTPAALSFRLAQAWSERGESELAQAHYKRAVQSDSSMATGYFALTLEY